MKSLDVCDSTQNDDYKESGKEGEGQEKKENRKEDVSKSLNGGDEGKGSDIVIKSEPVENGSKEILKTGDENNVADREIEKNGGLENSSGETDETTPTSTGEGRLNVESEAQLNGSETNCRNETTDNCQLVSGGVDCSEEIDLSVDVEKSDFHNWKHSQELKVEPMDVDSPSAADDPYKDVKSIIETSPMENFKEEENCSDNNVVEKMNQDERSFDMDEDTILDSDCDKENEKNVEGSGVNGFSKTDKDDSRVSLEGGSSSDCDIRVGECQTISGSDKDFLWSENESKKSQDSEENAVSPALDESDGVPQCNLEKTGGKEGNESAGEVEDVEGADKENEKEVVESNTVKSPVGKTAEEDMDESYLNKTDSDSEDRRSSPTSPQVESASTRKRKKSNEDEVVAESKKRKSICDGLATNLVSDDKDANDSSPSKIPSSLDTELTTITADQCETERASKKRALVDETNSQKSKTSGEETERLSTQQTVASSILTSLRGTLKNLTRSDLEELIVQKLCEVITERSTVGELRRKAQALEEDQERWRNKVQSLTKQMREMEMVMKKYLSEVQKQVKENPAQMVTPIKVTRSVGLQVSFYSSSSKQPKTIINLSSNTSSPSQNASPKNAKLLPNFTSVPSPRNKLAPSPQKAPTQSPKTPPSQSKKTVTTRSDSGSLPSKSPAQSLTNTNRAIQNQFSGAGLKVNYKAPSAVHVPQQNGSKVIDLTDDDDKQPASVGKSLSPIRVVNHLSQQPQVQANGRFAYYIPKTSSAGTGTSSGQSRPVLIAAPTVTQQNRPLMCSMPPLLFKGGTSGPGPQPQAQSGPNNRVILPKNLRHPAPLPQPPAHPVSRKNMKLLPPRPALKISKVQTGIVLSWNMTLGPEHAPIASYQLYAYQESNTPPTTSLWKKVGDVKALPLPMACTLTQFMSGHKYHFAVRAVDHHCRLGPFSFPGTIVLVK